VTYDRTCPRCKRPAEETAPRVCCARCGTYHHQGCWTTECASCGATQTIGQLDATRAASGRRLNVVLLSLTVVLTLGLVASVVSKIVAGDEFMLFSLARFAFLGVLWGTAWGLSKLFGA
jgi:hypothetical protein